MTYWSSEIDQTDLVLMYVCHCKKSDVALLLAGNDAILYYDYKINLTQT